MKIFKGTDSRVIGGKLAGSAVTFPMNEDGTRLFPFYWDFPGGQDRSNNVSQIRSQEWATLKRNN